VTTPYTPGIQPPSPLRALYCSKVQVLRLAPSLTSSGGMSLVWSPLTAVLDRTLDQSGYMWCRLDLGFIRPGKDFPAPLVAGRAPDRVGVCYYDLMTNAAGQPLVQSNDRLLCVQGPVYGEFEVRLVPDVAIDYAYAHHVEVQVIEVAKQTGLGSLTPFPGGAP
jgi:hypothetical protein